MTVDDSMQSRGAGNRASGSLSPADRIEINELFARWAWALDTGDEAAFTELCTEDARIEDAAGSFAFEPPGAAARFAQALIRDPLFPGRQHWIGQTLLTPDGDVWRARSFGMAPHLHSSARTNFLAWLGYYEDTLTKQNGRWRFKARTLHPWQGEVLAGFPRFPPPRDEDAS